MKARATKARATVTLVAPLALWLASVPIGAHHGFGTFAMNEDVEITGTVKDLAFVNPHAWLYLEVVGEDGEVTDMRCEMRSATTLRRSGWTPDLFPVGEQVTITGSPDRFDPYSCYVSTVIFYDGSSLDRYGQRTPPTRVVQGIRPWRLANGEPNVSGDFAQEQRVMTDPRGQRGTLVPLSQANNFADGGVPAGQAPIPGARDTPQAAQREPGARPDFGNRMPSGLTEAGQQAFEAIDFGDRYARSCVFTSIIADWSGEPVNRITQRGDSILMQYGRLGLERVVHMNQTEHAAVLEPTRVGHSIGRWDNEVLIVDTVGFLPGIVSGRTPHSEQLHVVEEFWFDADTRQLRRMYMAEDPLYLTDTIRGSDALDISDVPFMPEPCEDLTVGDDAQLGPRD